MTVPPQQPPPPAPPGDYVSLDLGERAEGRISRAAVIALFLGLTCLGSAIAGVAGEESPKWGIVAVFIVLGLFFTAFGALMVLGRFGLFARKKQFGPHRLVLDRTGFRELGTAYGEIFVPWSEFEAIDVIASDSLGGYNPWLIWTRMPNSRRSMGTTTVVEMMPTHPDEFARRVPFFSPAGRSEYDDTLLDEGTFGRAYFTEYDLRYQLLYAIRHYSNGRLGAAFDDTTRARWRGSQF